MDQPRYDAIDLFAGPGGWDVAAHHLGLSVLGVEFDHAACETRRAVGLATIEADVRDLNPLDHDAPGFIASPPCQTFSMAGKGAGRAELDAIVEAVREYRPSGTFADDRTGLVLEPLRWILARYYSDDPYEWIALEQVPAVLPIWEAYAETLRELGYSVATGILNAEQYGVPQTRRRAVLVARLDGEAQLPTPTHSRYYPRDKARLDEGVLPWVSMAQALGWGMTERPSMTVTGGGSSTGGAEPFGNAARQGMRREAEAGRWGVSYRANASAREASEPAGTIFFGARLNNVSWVVERPSTTVNCDPRISRPGRHDPNESGSQQRDAIRVTQAEAAVLQTFPADYPWQGTKTKQFQQIGNAVPPLLARAVLSALLRETSPATAREEAA